MKREKRSKFMKIGLDLFLYTIILVPLLLSILGYLHLETGSFNCNDSSINLHFRGNSVSRKHILTFIFLPIIALVYLTEWVQISAPELRSRCKESGRRTLFIFIRYWIACTVNILVNDVLKVLTAVPRPHFLETCQPDWDNINCTDNGGNVMFRRSICLSENTKAVLDSMKSWPSGHAQLISFSAVYMAVYIEKRIGEQTSLIGKRLLQIILFVITVYSSASRIQDQRHHVSDVFAGLLIGSVLALLFSRNIIPTSWNILQDDENETDDMNV
ncbi:phospholipid phosphatase 3 isoform X2 [Eurytemora carolleeae]|uniref:phospholipid phosphatase 3 isoform X2 n=1 Tax=Eurytemora carolleeae TaxID=1294199 RepID=UPI000C77E511|nr:phospholipid phosphatase 3 isoform X2 [Eurytemora carolleeae]|eukprot:XP_023325883.1 phospholipid phosphatase 3-like isoform X2 [Eurytemora affinis]